MAGQLPADPDVALARLQTVDGADVVEAAAGDVRARGRVGAGHHPAAAQRNGVHLVRRVGVPDDQLAVLRGGHQVSAELSIGKRERERLIQIEMEKMAKLTSSRSPSAWRRSWRGGRAACVGCASECAPPAPCWQWPGPASYHMPPCVHPNGREISQR